MSDETPQLTDVLALRADSLKQFREAAEKYLTTHPHMNSMVLGVSQYFADEAGDAVHEKIVAFPHREPTWPHVCSYGEAPPQDGSRCSMCDERTNGERELPWGFLDSNTEAVLAWSAFCTEWGGGEGSSSLVDPIAVVRRAEDGGFDLELVHQTVRAELDDNSVGDSRDEEFWDEEALPPKPEPVRAPWTGEERKLFEAVLANPRDDGPRRVMVDFWLERGDVRGEFGALSFETPKTSKDRRRRFELEQEHGRAWLGPLQQVVGFGGATFGRGPFAQRVSAALKLDRDNSRVHEIEEWALVESIEFVGLDRFFSKHMTGLTEVLGLNSEGFRRLAAAELKAPIATLGLVESCPPGELWAATASQVKRLIVTNAANTEVILAKGWPEKTTRQWSSLAGWDRLETVEFWFTVESEYEAGDPWNDDRATSALRSLGDTLGPNTTLKVGYQFGNGLRGGVIGVRKGGTKEITLEAGRFASPRAQMLAEGRLMASGSKLIETGAVAGAAKPVSGFRKFLARFGL